MKIGIKLLALVVVIAMITSAIGIYAIYRLIDAGDLAEIEAFVGKLDQSQKDQLKDQDLLLINGDTKGINTFTKAYQDMNDDHVPIFLTSDSVLHTYHVFFDDSLRSIEENELYPAAVNLSLAMLGASMEQYNATNGSIREYNTTNGSIQECAKKNVAYFSLALILLRPNVKIPDYVEDVVDQEKAKIEHHSGSYPSSIFGGDVLEDYSQYLPRGHYTRSEVLSRYFKAMMWYGRIYFSIGSTTMTTSAILMADAMLDASFNGQSAMNLWSRIYDITTRFVGESEDLTPMDYQKGIKATWGDLPHDYSVLEDPNNMTQFTQRINMFPEPQIAPMIGKGLRFMGQRFIPDSYMMQRLVYDNITEYTGSKQAKPFTYVNMINSRGFPRGLDVMSILGSKMANTILKDQGDTDYIGYDDEISALKDEFTSISKENWTSNMYSGWLYALKSLTGDFKDKGNLKFMQGSEWQKVKLNTNLGSWAELRHDTILYAKQSQSVATSIGPSIDQVPEPDELGFVEPVPTFYQRLVNLTKGTLDDLKEHGILSTMRENEMNNFINMLDRLISMSNKELEGRELSGSDYEYLRNIGNTFMRLTGSAMSDGLQTTIIADVHTEVNSRKVLEEGLGYVDFMVVKLKKADGSAHYAVGPTFSYYEFKQPMDDRLTDEKWTSMLIDGTAHGRPNWLKTCYGE